MVTPEGLEPSTWRLEVACSVLLSYGALAYDQAVPEIAGLEWYLRSN